MTQLDERPTRTTDDRRSRWVWLGAGTVAVLVALVLVSTGSSSSRSSSTVSSGTASTSSRGEASAGVASAPVPATATVKGRVPLGAPALGGAPADAAGKATVTGAPGQDSARIVKTGQVDLVVGKGGVSRTVSAVQALVLAAHGYASDSTTSESGSAPTATTTYRVPVASFERVLGQVRAVRGTTVSGTSTGGQDVTGSYADTQAQIQSLTAARSRFLSILAQAKTIAETLSVQQRVDDVQGRIDQLESQRRVLASSSDLSTLTVSVTTKGTAEPRTGGLGRAWSQARHGFASGIEALVAHSGRAAVVLLVAALLLGLGWLVRRRLT